MTNFGRFHFIYMLRKFKIKVNCLFLYIKINLLISIKRFMAYEIKRNKIQTLNLVIQKT